jgi:hypothetical protein
MTVGVRVAVSTEQPATPSPAYLLLSTSLAAGAKAGTDDLCDDCVVTDHRLTLTF